jgi:hypothetical protein
VLVGFGGTTEMMAACVGWAEEQGKRRRQKAKRFMA